MTLSRWVAILFLIVGGLATVFLQGPAKILSAVAYLAAIQLLVSEWDRRREEQRQAAMQAAWEDYFKNLESDGEPEEKPEPEKKRTERPKRRPAREIPVPECLKILGLDRGATRDEIKQAFRRRVRDVHPDRGGDDEAFIELRKAYERALDLIDGKPR